MTSRDCNTEFSSSTKICHVQPFDDDAGISAFLSLTGFNSDTPSNHETSKQILHTLGGLPLASSQISGFIVQQKLALEDFLPLFERKSASIDARRLATDYEHVLNTV